MLPVVFLERLYVTNSISFAPLSFNPTEGLICIRKPVEVDLLVTPDPTTNKSIPDSILIAGARASIILSNEPNFASLGARHFVGTTTTRPFLCT